MIPANGKDISTDVTTSAPNNRTSNSSRSLTVENQNSNESVANNSVQTFTRATAGDFVAKNKLQAGLGRSGWHLALKSALGTLQKGKIPLLLAVEAGNQSMCRELLGQQTAEQLKATTDNGDAAIHLAARRRDVDMVRILVDYGTNVDMQNVSRHVDGFAKPLQSNLFGMKFKKIEFLEKKNKITIMSADTFVRFL